MKLRYEPRLAYVLQGVPIRFTWRFVYTVGRGLFKCANQKRCRYASTGSFRAVSVPGYRQNCLVGRKYPIVDKCA